MKCLSLADKLRNTLNVCHHTNTSVDYLGGECGGLMISVGLNFYFNC